MAVCRCRFSYSVNSLPRVLPAGIPKEPNRQQIGARETELTTGKVSFRVQRSIYPLWRKSLYTKKEAATMTASFYSIIM